MMVDVGKNPIHGCYGLVVQESDVLFTSYGFAILEAKMSIVFCWNRMFGSIVSGKWCWETHEHGFSYHNPYHPCIVYLPTFGGFFNGKCR